MEVGMIRQVDIDQEMQQAYLDYAMSVIVSRALPDARDGLKPVQRRILYAMQDLNLSPGAAYKKSARIVGEVLGKYHPHGDVAVYEAMARLAQDFSMRVALVDGQGNFGSIDGDPPAAMRYTEARLTRFSTELMNEIDRDTVDFGDNFDSTLREPLVLPAAVPNLLVNGASGIAVGMATSIPPHNLGEVIDALVFMIERWEKMDDLAVPELMQFIKGPDFPTGGLILQESGENAIETAYGTGRGRVIVRGKVHAEDLGRGRQRLIITELPYQVNKTNLIERIAELAREGNIDGIADLRDESDRQGMRIVIELKQGVESEDILRALYKSTPLQNTFGINLLALVDGEPRLLNLKQALRVFVEHRLVVVRRRSEFDLARARARAHILEGLRTALKNLDEIIILIRAAPDADTARSRMVKRFALSEAQAQAILDLQLRRLAALERKKIEEEYKEVTALIKDLESLLGSKRRMRETVSAELLEMKRQYAERRRTQIVALKEGTRAAQLLTVNDLVPTQDVWVGVTKDGRIARSHGALLPDQSGEGSARHTLRVSTKQTLYLMAESGNGAALSVTALPEGETFADGVPLYKASALATNDVLAAMLAIDPEESGSPERFVMAVTRKGMLKKTAFSELPGPSAQRFTMIKVNPGDKAMTVFATSGTDTIGLFSDAGMGIRFAEDDVRPMGLVAAGVMGMKLGAKDSLAAALPWKEKSDLLLLASDGSALRFSGEDYPLQGRNGQGVIACKLTGDSRIITVLMGAKNYSALAITEKGDPRRIKIGEVLASRRNARMLPFLPARAGRLLAVAVLGEYDQSRAASGSSTQEAPARRTRSTAAAGKKVTARSLLPEAKSAGRSKAASKPAPASPGAKKVATEKPAARRAPAKSTGSVSAARTVTPTKGTAPAKKTGSAPTVKPPASKSGTPGKPSGTAKKPPATRKTGRQASLPGFDD